MISNCISGPCLFYIIFTILIVYLLYKLSIGSFNLENQFGFQGPKPLPLIGNTLEYIKYGFHFLDLRNQKQYGHIYPIYMGRTGILVVSDDAILRQILVKDARSFIDRPEFRVLPKLLKKSLSQLTGKDWERVRALVTPTFTSGKLKKMSPMIVASVNEMINRFKSAENGDIDVKQIFGSLTMDVIAKTMFGIDINTSNKSSNSFVNHARKIFSLSQSNFINMFIAIFPSLKQVVEKIFPKGIKNPESIQFFSDSIAKTIESRRNSKEEFHDFLALMLNAHNELQNESRSEDGTSETKIYKGLTEEEIMAQSIVFLLAGYETTASALTFCTYYLAQNPDIQEEVYRELMEKVPDEQEITYDVLSNLNLIEQCLKETLRKCPPAARLIRLCTSDTTLTTSSGQLIQAKKGMSFVVPVYAIHHDEEIWSEPDKFDIHRFDQEAKQNRSQFAFMPFGSGPRMCIGMRFALLEAKLALAHLLRTYKIVKCDQTPTELTFGTSGLTTSTKPVILRVEKRYFNGL